MWPAEHVRCSHAERWSAYLRHCHQRECRALIVVTPIGDIAFVSNSARDHVNHGLRRNSEMLEVMVNRLHVMFSTVELNIESTLIPLGTWSYFVIGRVRGRPKLLSFFPLFIFSHVPVVGSNTLLHIWWTWIYHEYQFWSPNIIANTAFLGL